ncbi:flagellar biosynthesis protein FlaG [Pseudoalteromonas aurantia]|uniref:flagellar protein FlaG n=1 Tax=Pseudoalteromonas aurantia TaxID=43654 RepID=UPI00110C0D61|nr:flagellar protein FlaG [Pseudoalteromonas aurantia]TMO63254.1 flagellar biosynthesis protein FlaG [Pseudoalteromonas aurantia]
MREVDSGSSIVNILTTSLGSEKMSGGVDYSRAAEKVEKANNAIEDTKNKALEDKELGTSLQESLDRVNEFLSVQSTSLSFEFDEKGDPPIIKVIDQGSEEVIREIPSKEFREVAKALEELADKLDNKGVLVNETA